MSNEARIDRAAELRAKLLASRPGTFDDDPYHWIITIGKEGLEELRPDVEPYLTHADGEIRSAALRCLVFYWALPDCRDLALRMLEADPDPHVRAVALMGIGGYYVGTRNAPVLDLLARLLYDRSQPYLVRAAAYVPLLKVGAVARQDLPSFAPSGDKLDSAVDWRLVERILADAGVKIPKRDSVPRAR